MDEGPLRDSAAGGPSMTLGSTWAHESLSLRKSLGAPDGPTALAFWPGVGDPGLDSMAAPVRFEGSSGHRPDGTSTGLLGQLCLPVGPLEATSTYVSALREGGSWLLAAAGRAASPPTLLYARAGGRGGTLSRSLGCLALRRRWLYWKTAITPQTGLADKPPVDMREVRIGWPLIAT